MAASRQTDYIFRYRDEKIASLLFDNWTETGGPRGTPLTKFTLNTARLIFNLVELSPSRNIYLNRSKQYNYEITRINMMNGTTKTD